jgi:uncharacterized protein YyaL (SSP411 family)
MAVTTLLKLGGSTNDVHYVDMARFAFSQMQTPTGGDIMSQYALGLGQWLQAPAYALLKPLEIAIVGDLDSASTQALVSVARGRYRPFQIAALETSSQEVTPASLLPDRCLVNGRSAVCIHRNFVCQALLG